MQHLLFVGFAASVLAVACPVQAAEKPLLGIVSIAANEANNARYIAGASAM